MDGKACTRLVQSSKKPQSYSSVGNKDDAGRAERYIATPGSSFSPGIFSEWHHPRLTKDLVCFADVASLHFYGGPAFHDVVRSLRLRA